MATVLVAGSDGVVPIYEENGLWRTWSKHQTWDGTTGEGRFVPKLMDHVIDPETNERWLVIGHHPTTMVPVLKSIALVKNGVINDDDLLIGVGPGPDAQTYRAYLNKRTSPYTLSCEARCFFYGTMVEYVKIFLGSDTTETGIVISRRYNSSGVFVSNNIPLEVVQIDSHTNYTTKVIPRCKITEDLVSGERITIVAYSADGHVVSKRQMVVEVSDLDMDVTAAVNYIEDIGLESIWLRSDGVLEYPLNIPLDALNMMGVVKYSNGQQMKLPIDGNKFRMFGLSGRISSIPGQPKDLVLAYSMSASEQGNSSSGVMDRIITKPYRIVTGNPNYSIAVKLFGFPFWNSTLNQYQMRWFLLNMERNVWFEVTSLVQYLPSTGPFDPILYGTIQRKRVSINLRSVSSSFITFVHPQSVDIVLNGAPQSVSTQGAWSIGTESSDQYPRYGENVYAERVGSSTINLSSGFLTQEEWLDSIYYRLRPLVDVTTESRPPAPTHFIVTHGSSVTEWSISDWNKPLAVNTLVTVNGTITIRWIKRTAAGDLQLAIGALMVKNVA